MVIVRAERTPASAESRKRRLSGSRSSGTDSGGVILDVAGVQTATTLAPVRTWSASSSKLPKPVCRFLADNAPKTAPSGFSGYTSGAAQLGAN